MNELVLNTVNSEETNKEWLRATEKKRKKGVWAFNMLELS
jgi:hypothetical protein